MAKRIKTERNYMKSTLFPSKKGINIKEKKVQQRSNFITKRKNFISVIQNA